MYPLAHPCICLSIEMSWTALATVPTQQDDLSAGGAAAPSTDPLVNLLDLNDVFGSPPQQQSVAPALVLEDRPVLEPAVFQVGFVVSLGYKA